MREHPAEVSPEEQLSLLRMRQKALQDTPVPRHTSWRTWFEGEEYLGEISARTGPDPAKTDQPCNCHQCKPEVK